MRATDREHTAYHEAGHAVIGRVLWMYCGQVSIEEDEDSGGHSITSDPWAIQWQWELAGKFRDASSVFRGRVMTFMAGRESEVVFFGDDHGRDGDDRMQIMLMFDWLVRNGSIADDAAIEAHDGRLRAKVRGLIVRHRAAIDGLANELLSKGTLSNDEVDSYLADQHGIRIRPILSEPQFDEAEDQPGHVLV